ncbi:MAG: glycosyltransferase [Chitinivibrionales bacterium]|nr:glycosyltransferase [Chitinivibrionales bacterium]MBD3356916.1 glycosyltransferase [Chitinivibrionales bacterium]
MAIHAFLGGNMLTVILLAVALGTVIIVLVSTVFAAFYHRSLYDKFYRSHYDTTFKPRCTVVIPCKGVVRGLRENLASFLKLDYPDYEVIFAVECRDDEAVPIIEGLVATSDRARLVVAGLSSSCAQKNYNMLAAIKQANNPEVYVFADADIGPEPHWLQELVLPLSSQKVTATTGFRWQYSANGKLGEQIHSYMNNMIYVFFSIACYAAGVGLWGGSMAIRRKDFEELGVAKRWGETVVDDISLSQLTMKHSRKTILVPSCVVSTDDALPSVRLGTRWLERQAMFLKAYHTGTWALLVSAVAVCLGLVLWLPGALLVSGISDWSFMSIGGGASLVLVAGVMLTTLLHPMLGENPTFVRFVLLQPLSFFWLLVGILKTPFTHTVIWSGVRYRLTLSGKVASIDRGG